MKTRGPNSQASCQGTNWVLGHTRLSIIDLEGGSQPMQDRTTGVSLSYNGELYNHLHLRKQLQQLGHSFMTQSDTEVLLRSYIEWGQDCLQKLDGCFAFAVIDPRNENLFIARDRLGVKPLYYYRDDESISFASSVAALKKICGKQQVDLAAVSHYFTTCRITFGEKTLYKNIYTLLPGTWKNFSLNSSKIQEEKYWHRPALAEDEKKETDEEELLHNTRTLVNDAVSKRLMSDVPLGCFLSGGLDSAVVVDIAQNNSSERLPLYCAGTPFEKYNEFRYAAEVAQRLGSSVDEITISTDTFMDDWRRLIQLKGLPLSTPNETSIYRLAKALSSQCKVALTGEASDEIFGGYVGPHFGIHDYLRAPHSDSPKNLQHPLYWKMMQRYGRSFFYNEADHFFLSSSWMPMAQKSALFSADAWNSLENDDEVFTFYEDFFERYAHVSVFDRRMHLHAEVNLEGLLNRVDSSTMAASIEARVPFTDHHLVEYVFRQKDKWKMTYRKGYAAHEFEAMMVDEIQARDVIESKKMLRRAFSSRVPKSIIQRPKMSFPVPFQEWLSGPLAKELEDMCLKTVQAHEFISQSEVKKMFERQDRNLWLLANICLWLDEN